MISLDFMFKVIIFAFTGLKVALSSNFYQFQFKVMIFANLA